MRPLKKALFYCCFGSVIRTGPAGSRNTFVLPLFFNGFEGRAFRFLRPLKKALFYCCFGCFLTTAPSGSRSTFVLLLCFNGFEGRAFRLLRSVKKALFYCCFGAFEGVDGAPSRHHVRCSVQSRSSQAPGPRVRTSGRGDRLALTSLRGEVAGRHDADIPEVHVHMFGGEGWP